MAEGVTVAIDGGATSTDLLMLERSSYEGVIVSGGGTNPNASGMECLDELDRLIDKASDGLEISQGRVDEIIAGMAGRGNPKNRKAFQAKLETLFPEAHIQQINDSELAHRGIWGTGAGFTILAGTGSVGIGTNEDGRIYFTGGLGHMVGDEGSGFWLMKTALTELITNERSTDNNMEQLQDSLIKRFDSNNFEDLLEKLTNEMNAPPLIAFGAPVILEAAENGNFFADHIVSRGAEHLTGLIVELHEKMGEQKGDLTLGCTGSVIKKSAYYRKSMESSLQYEFDSVDWRESSYLPVYGGLVLSSNRFTPDDFKRLEVKFV